MTSLIKCRKCGGPHVTIKCGKNEAPQITEVKNNYTKRPIEREVKFDRRKIVTVRITNLPNDITIEELSDLMHEWGKIGRVNINNYNESTSGFIDFYFRDEAEYFVKALDRTPFERMIIGVEILDGKY
jgi:hypothetical protein